MAEVMAAWPFSGLWFSERDEENRFAEGYGASHFAPVDNVYRRFGCIMGLAFAFGRVADDYRNNGGLTWRGGVALGISATAIVLDCLWFAWRGGANPERRTKMVLVKRLATAALSAILAPQWFSDPVTSSKTFARFLLMNTGLLALIFHSLVNPLLARHHLMVHVPTVAFMAFNTPGAVCRESVIGGQGAQYIQAAWRALSAVCTGMTASFPTPGVHRCCNEVVVFSLVVGGLWVPSYLMWAWECRARFAYDPEHSPPLNWKSAAVHWMLFTVLLSCVWTVLHDTV